MLSGLETVNIVETDRESIVCDDDPDLTDKCHNFNFIQELKENVLKNLKDSDELTDEDNFYYNPQFSRDFERFLKTILLTSGIMNSTFQYGQPRESSATIESYFKDLKHCTLKQYQLPMKLDKFIPIHVNAINGMITLANYNFEPETVTKDEEDLFMVSDLLLGGDLRYHIQQEVYFNEEAVKLTVCELALALDYLQSKHIVHRDIKPDNILLDEEGHMHLTDFNIAAVIKDGQLASSMSGTKPYIAPEVFDCAVDLCVGYSYAVDWWSLGVVAYEMLWGRRPFDIHSNTTIQEVRLLFHNGCNYPHSWKGDVIDLLTKLLCISPGERVSTVQELKKIKCLSHYDMDLVFQRKYKPFFAPPKDHLNCDPTFELEEMIIETKPLHKKKKRLAKQRSIRETQPLNVEVETDSPMELNKTIIPEFKIYNRYQELARREKELKELAWERELQQAMEASDPLASNDVKQTCSSCAQKRDIEVSLQKHFRACDSDLSENSLVLDKCTNDTIVDTSCSMLDKISQLNSQTQSNENAKDLRVENIKSNSSTICNMQNKLQNIDFIDRSPSPIDRLKST